MFLGNEVFLIREVSSLPLERGPRHPPPPPPPHTTTSQGLTYKDTDDDDKVSLVVKDVEEDHQ